MFNECESPIDYNCQKLTVNVVESIVSGKIFEVCETCWKEMEKLEDEFGNKLYFRIRWVA